MGRPRFHAFAYWYEAVLTMLLGGLLLFAGVLSPNFLGIEAQIEMSTHVWELALLALPMTLIIITAGIDLSIGSMMALCAVVLGLMLTRKKTSVNFVQLLVFSGVVGLAWPLLILVLVFYGSM